MVKRVLVVDDELNIVRLVSTRLMASGYEVLSAGSGSEALELASRHRPDAIVLDVMMPGLDGGAVAQKLGESTDTARIPIIFLTALIHESEAKALGQRGQYYLAKPFKATDLLNLLDQLVT
jgi:CheY-like chemotaxis protein